MRGCEEVRPHVRESWRTCVGALDELEHAVDPVRARDLLLRATALVVSRVEGAARILLTQIKERP